MPIPPQNALDFASTLAVGDSGYIEHEGCTPNPKMWVVKNTNGISAYCNKCGEKWFKPRGIVPLNQLTLSHTEDTTEFDEDIELPDDCIFNPKEFPIEAKMWLYKADIRDFQIEKYGIGYSKQMHRVILPVYDEWGDLMMWQGRGLLPSQTKYYNLRGSGKSGYFFKSWVSYEKVHGHHTRSVVVVEDILSVIKVGRVHQALTGLGTSLSQKQINYLSNFDNVIFWYDDDKGGLNGSVKGMRELSLVTNCYRVRTEKDPKLLSYDEIRQSLQHYGGESA